MNSPQNGKKFRASPIFVALITFFLGVVIVSVLSGVFNWNFIPVVLIAGGIGLLAYKMCCGSCCSR